MIQTEFRQQHFILYELVLPYCTACTPTTESGSNQWHTPVTCEESSDTEYRLWFTSNKAPLMTQPTPSISGKSILNSKVFRVVTSGDESTAKLKPAEGLSSRSTMKMACVDFSGDPGPINFSDEGTFFGKLIARNVLSGKKIISHYYTMLDETSPPVLTGSATHFIESTELSGGQFSIGAKDALKDIEALSQKFPFPSEVEITSDIDATQTSFDVNDSTGLIDGSVIRIDDELLRLNANPIGNTISVYTRGQSFSADSVIVYKTRTDEHTAEATVQPCYPMWGYRIYDVLQVLFVESGLGAFVNYAQWKAEIDEWNSDAKLYGVLHTSDKFESVINSILSHYMIDMWLDQNSQLLVVSAVSAWKDSKRQLTEGNDFSKLKTKTLANERYSRAMIYSYKEYKTDDDDPVNYSKLILRTDLEKEHSDFYGDIKLKEFENSEFMKNSDAISLCQRYIQRFADAPKQISFTMEERKLANTKLGDVVEVISRDSQTAEGLYLTSKERVQITRIQPDLNNVGRMYNITSLSYAPLLASNPGEELTITLSGSLFDVNLYAEAGKPNLALNITFVFDGATIGSTSTSFYSMTAAGFVVGSRVRVILINNSTWSAIGGSGGNVSYTEGVAFSVFTNGATTHGGNGGGSFNSGGVDCHVYLNYNVDTYSASSQLFASGGGGGSAASQSYTNTGLGFFSFITSFYAAIGGSGSGIPGGAPGKLVGVIQSGGSNINTTGKAGGFSSAGSVTYSEVPPFAGSGQTISDGGRFTASNGLWVETGGSVANGGVSANGDIGTAYATSNSSDASSQQVTTPTSNGGLAGYAFVGSSITVYNTNSSKLRDGRNNGSGYTLISV